MAFGDIVAVYSKNHIKPINIPCGQNAELLINKPGHIYSCRWVLKSQTGPSTIDYVRKFVHKLQIVTCG